MNKRVKAFFCLSILILAGSFVYAKKQNDTKKQEMPVWVFNPSQVFSNDEYFNSVGTGIDRNTAEINAVSSLASIFGQSVRTETKSSKRMEQAANEGKVATVKIDSFNQDILKSINVKSLIGVEIKEYWFDGKETWYAIAILNKAQAESIYSELINKNISTLSKLLHSTEKDYYSMESYAALDFAYEVAKDTEELVKMLSVISIDVATDLSKKVKASEDIALMKQNVSQNIPICILASGDDSGKISAGFIDILARYGFKGTFNANSRYVLVFTVSFEESNTTDNSTIRCRYNLEGSLVDSSNDTQLVPIKISGREGHKIYTEAKARAVKAIEKKIEKTFNTSFNIYLQSYNLQ